MRTDYETHDDLLWRRRSDQYRRAKKMETYLTAEGLLDKVRISQGTVAEAATRSDLDFIVSTSPAKVAVPVINALPLLTGMGTDKVFESVKAQILG
ncbi:hypothetical protein SODG_004022 [Sodalis praecaptivus]